MLVLDFEILNIYVVLNVMQIYLKKRVYVGSGDDGKGAYCDGSDGGIVISNYPDLDIYIHVTID